MPWAGTHQSPASPTLPGAEFLKTKENHQERVGRRPCGPKYWMYVNQKNMLVACMMVTGGLEIFGRFLMSSKLQLLKSIVSIYHLNETWGGMESWLVKNIEEQAKYVNDQDPKSKENSHITGVKFSFVSNEEVESHAMQQTEGFANAKTVPGTTITASTNNGYRTSNKTIVAPRSIFL